jgi:hypothetical protein
MRKRSSRARCRLVNGFGSPAPEACGPLLRSSCVNRRAAARPFAHPFGLVAKINDLSREHNMIELYKIMIWHFIDLCQV